MTCHQDKGCTGASDGKAEIVVRSVLNAIQILTREDQKPGIEQITTMVQCDPKIAELLNPSSGRNVSRKDEILREKKEMEVLKAQLQKSMTARRAMVAQLDTAERQLAKTREFMLRAFLVTLRYVDTGKDRQLRSKMSHIRDLLKKQAPVHELDAAFQELKAFELADELDNGSSPPSADKPSGVIRLKRPVDEPDLPMERFRKRYRKMIDGLKSSLDVIALRDIAVVEQRLGNALDAYDLLDVQKELQKLLKTYVQRIGRDREQAAGCILEIEEQLAEVQRQVVHCFTAVRDTGEAGARFSTAIEKEMVRMKDVVDTANDLEELKSRVVGSIGMLKDALEKKRKDEWDQAQKMDEEMSSLNKTLERMKLEVVAARKRSKRLETEIKMDALTGINSRRAFEDQMEAMFEDYRQARRSFSILLLGLDRFKEINERYGHAVGDVCLKGIAAKIRPLLKDAGFFARFEGDEFVIALPGIPASVAEKTGEKVRAYIERTNFLHKGEKVRVTLSIGIAQINGDATSPKQLITRAEEALGRAKAAGRNRVASAGL